MHFVPAFFMGNKYGGFDKLNHRKLNFWNSPFFYWEINMVKIIHTGPFGVNTLIVNLSGNKVFIVDPACCELCGDEKSVSAYIEANRLEVAAIVLTHGHFDHIAGLNFLHKVYGSAPVMIHKNDSNRLGPDAGIIHSRELSYMGFEAFIPAVSSLPPADCYLEEGKSLFQCMPVEKRPGLEDVREALSDWKILYTPGHTSGCICLHNKKEKILISGDTLFYGSWGRTDLGGSEKDIQESLKRLRKEIPEDTLVYPGHDITGFKMSDNY